MSKRIKQYEIRVATRGSFAGAQGRVSYDLEAGIVSEKDVEAEVLVLLLAAGVAFDPSEPAPAKALEPEPAESEEEETA